MRFNDNNLPLLTEDDLNDSTYIPGSGTNDGHFKASIFAKRSVQNRQSDLIYTLQTNCYDLVKWESGSISSGNGEDVEHATRCRTRYIRIDDITSLKKDSTAVAAAKFLCMYYTEDFTYISYLNDISEWVKGTTAIPVNAYYVRFVSKYYFLPTDVYTHSIFTLNTALEKIDAQSKEIDRLNTDVYGASVSVSWEDGSIISGTGVEEESTTRCRTGLVPVYNLDEIYTDEGQFMLCFYGEDGTYYPHDFVNNKTIWFAKTYTGSAKYVRIVDKSHTSDNGTNTHVTIVPKSGVLNIGNKITFIKDFTTSCLCADGDSITAGSQWASVVRNKLNFADLVNIAVGSSSWADRMYTLNGTTYVPQENVDDPSFAGFSSSTSHSAETIQAEVNNCSRIHLLKYISDVSNALKPSPDVFVFAFGTNDISNAYHNTLGNADEALATGKVYPTGDMLFTLAGAMKWTLQKALETFQNCKFYVSLPIQSGNSSRNESNLLKIEVMVKIAKAFSIPIIDQYNNCGINVFFENASTEGRYLRDGLHPKANGISLMGTFAAEQIVSKWSGQ